MKARCRCGHVFDVRPEDEGKKVKCPGCGRVVRLPTSPSAAPPHAEEQESGGEPEFDWGREFALEDEEGEALRETGAEKEAERIESEGMDSEWGDEFSLEEEEPEERPSGPGAGEEIPSPPQGEADRFALEFDSGEFHVEPGAEEAESEGGEAPVELGPGQIISVRESSAPRGAAPGPAAAGRTKVCPSCGRVVTEAVAACPECGAPLEAGEVPGEAERRAPSWAGSFFGAFLYAYPAVLAGDGWQAWLKYAVIGAFLPILSIMIGALTCIGLCAAYPFAIAVLFGSILGGMYLYMGQAAANGAEPLREVRPAIINDMIVPFLLIAGSSIVLVIAPIFAAGFVANAVGAVPFDEVVNSLKGGGESLGFSQILRLLMASGVLVAGFLFGLFCFPMVVMLLGASQKVTTSLNPVNVFRAIFKAPGPYLALWAFFMFNILITPFLLSLAQGALRPVREDFIGGLFINFVTMAIAIFMASATGWRMGIFLHRNASVFDHVR